MAREVAREFKITASGRERVNAKGDLKLRAVGFNRAVDVKTFEQWFWDCDAARWRRSEFQFLHFDALAKLKAFGIDPEVSLRRWLDELAGGPRLERRTSAAPEGKKKLGGHRK